MTRVVNLHSQLVGTIVASSTYFATAWWLLTNIKDICDQSFLPEGSPWTCPQPQDDFFYHASTIWGVIGPLRMFTKYGIYKEMNWFFLFGLAPISGWFLSRKYPNIKWLRHTCLSSLELQLVCHQLVQWTIGLGELSELSSISMFTESFKAWWARHTYVLSAALDAGVAFSGVLVFFTLQYKNNIFGPEWWGLANDDHCPLASCPTAPGVKIEGVTCLLRCLRFMSWAHMTIVLVLIFSISKIGLCVCFNLKGLVIWKNNS